jgi:hypothetical protein
MFNSLGDLWNANQERLTQQGVKPGQQGQAGIFGTLIASGVMPRDAYVQAAKMTRDQEVANMDRQKQEQAQEQQHQFRQLADYVRSNPNVSNQELAGAAIQFGVDPRYVPAFLGALGAEDKVIQDVEHGPQIFRKHAGRITGQDQQNESMALDTNNPAMGTTQNGGLGAQVPPKMTVQPSSMLGRSAAKIEYKSAKNKEEREAKESAEYTKKIQAEGRGALDVVEDANQIEQLIPQLFTGKYSGNKLETARFLGTNKESVEAQDLFNGRVSSLLEDLEAQKVGGRATDAAAKLILSAKPKETNDTEANLSIIRGIKARAEGQAERTEAYNMWVERGGDPKKFEQKWFEYERKHPFIKIGKNGRLSVNDENLIKWRKELFGEEIGEFSNSEPKQKETATEAYMRLYGAR